MTIKKLQEIISGSKCIRCENTRLYKLGDGRFKCSGCSERYRISRIQEDLKLLHYFSLEVPANKAARDLGIGYKKVRLKYMGYREQIARFLDEEFERLRGEIECDESYFGGRRKGNRGRGSTGKTKVFGMLERKGKIFTTVVDDVRADSLMGAIKRYSVKGSVFYTDQFKSYKSLKFYGKHYTVDHAKRFKLGERHINGLEGFWSFAKERFQKYHGVSKNHFKLYLKEMEFRYNYRKVNLSDLLVKIHFSPILT